MSATLPRPFEFERRDAAMEDRETGVADGAHVAHEAVRHGADRAPGTRRRRQQFAPGRDALGTAAAEDDDLPGFEVVDDPDLELVGVLALGDVKDLAEQAGAREAGHDKLVI